MVGAAKPRLSPWRAFWLSRRARHARRPVRASMVAFDAGKRALAEMLLGEVGKVVAEIGAAIG